MKIHFIHGEKRVIAEAAPGDRLLDVAQAADMPLEGTCEGAMACSTCHVIIDPEWAKRLKPAREEEEDMLDFAAGVTRTSRLACQIWLRESEDGLVVHMPVLARNLLGKS